MMTQKIIKQGCHEKSQSTGSDISPRLERFSVCVYICMYARLYMYVCVCMCVCMYVRLCMYVCMCVYVCVCACVCLYVSILEVIR